MEQGGSGNERSNRDGSVQQSILAMLGKEEKRNEKKGGEREEKEKGEKEKTASDAIGNRKRLFGELSECLAV